MGVQLAKTTEKIDRTPSGPFGSSHISQFTVIFSFSASELSTYTIFVFATYDWKKKNLLRLILNSVCAFAFDCKLKSVQDDDVTASCSKTLQRSRSGKCTFVGKENVSAFVLSSNGSSSSVRVQILRSTNLTGAILFYMQINLRFFLFEQEKLS